MWHHDILNVAIKPTESSQPNDIFRYACIKMKIANQIEMKNWELQFFFFVSFLILFYGSFIILCFIVNGWFLFCSATNSFVIKKNEKKKMPKSTKKKYVIDSDKSGSLITTACKTNNGCQNLKKRKKDSVSGFFTKCWKLSKDLISKNRKISMFFMFKW